MPDRSESAVPDSAISRGRMRMGFGTGPAAQRRPFWQMTRLYYSPELWTVRVKLGGMGRFWGVYVSRCGHA